MAKREVTICDVCRKDLRDVRVDSGNIVFDGSLFANYTVCMTWPPVGRDKYAIQKTKELKALMEWDLCSHCEKKIEEEYAKEYDAIMEKVKR